MNRLVIIGNGFDLAHNLKTSYKDFIDWYLEQRVMPLLTLSSRVSEDALCRFEIPRDSPYYRDWFIYSQNHNFFRNSQFIRMDAKSILSIIEEDESCLVKRSLLLDRITQNIENKGWTDIESDYYQLLKQNMDNQIVCKLLNDQLDYLRKKLAEYLATQENNTKIKEIRSALNEKIDKNDIALSFKKSIMDQVSENMNDGNYKPQETMFLNFNYTNKANKYWKTGYKINQIHGSLNKPNEMIFGYGDEMDKDFQALIDRNENALLENSKSIKYLETSHYRDLLSFIEGGPFQVYIMGHSCGNSDRTLLNTIFEHQNCISIKPFCYINEKGEDNYSELTRNIYRNFTDKKLFRDRVVNKERCTTLDGQPLVGKD